MLLVDEIGDQLCRPNERGLPLTPLQQICLAMTYYASGTFQRTAGFLSGVRKSCACKTIRRVTNALCQLAPEVIQMPTQSEMEVSAAHFEHRFGLPNFALGVDGTHVRLGLRPSEKDLPNGVNPQDFWCPFD